MGDIVSRYEKASKLSSWDFKQLFGVKKETFDAMVTILKAAYAAKHKRRGRHTKLSLEDQTIFNSKIQQAISHLKRTLIRV
ncbi:MAG: hypothetical protein LBE70_01855 [Nitrososphaerota archaeon]|jgi:hypothetical protein|nr:hypothetical protein [Nitrososphaerota archaeon]